MPIYSKKIMNIGWYIKFMCMFVMRKRKKYRSDGFLDNCKTLHDLSTYWHIEAGNADIQMYLESRHLTHCNVYTSEAHVPATQENEWGMFSGSWWALCQIWLALT